jgi:acyl-coenzyme A synthetase/AMP-(fatty) acid ligase
VANQISNSTSAYTINARRFDLQRLLEPAREEKGHVRRRLVSYVGGADDLFKVNGRWLSPAEVERVLVAHPAVREAGVVAREDGAGLLQPAANVILNESFVPSDELRRELQDWVGHELSSYKKPQ